LVHRIVATIATAVAMFAATDIDDAVVLVVFNISSRAAGAPKRWEIWAGQFVGIGLLVLVSFLAALGLGAVPVKWVGVLGLIPLLRGIQGLAELIRDRGVEDPDPPALARGLGSVLAITVANGGDNIALWTAAFRIMGAADALLTVAVFAVCVAVWCLVGQLAISHRGLVEAMQRSSRWLVPVVLTVLGMYIIGRSGLPSLLW
jgi:cadmium resistance protein CadD (predicted permease)